MLNNTVRLKKTKKRFGRGGDHGGTSGGGHKGQRARSGRGMRPQFEGGQTPLTRRLPKQGFNNAAFRKEYSIITLDDVSELATAHNISVFTPDVFFEYGIVRNKTDKIKLLANGAISIPVEITIHASSRRAQEMVEQVGGKVHIQNKNVQQGYPQKPVTHKV